jgi:hypothetical protein
MDTDNRSRAIWSRLGGQLGVGLCLVGFILVFLGWNGAASVDRITSQFPYLISGGIAGLCFIVLGVGMIIVQNQRADRAALQTTLNEVREALERAGVAAPAGGQRATLEKPLPRPEALAGARSPEGERPIVAAEPEPVEPTPPAPKKKAPAKRTAKRAAGS